MKQTIYQRQKKFFSFLLLLIITVGLKAQGVCPPVPIGCELIVNGSVESNTSIPQSEAYNTPSVYQTIQMACSWENGTGTSIASTPPTPDYYTSSSPVSALPYSSVHVPANWQGTQAAHTGNCYLGFYAQDNGTGGSIYKEYVSQQLRCPLIKGVTYRVSFWICLAGNSTYYTDHIGAAFTDFWTMAGNNNNTQIFFSYPSGVPGPNFVPQIPAAPITSTSIWTPVSGTFIADGTEEYIVIGDFGSTSTYIGPPPVSTGTSYYYLDDVSVQPVNNLVISASPNAFCSGSTTTLSNNLDVTLPLSWNPSAGLSCNNCGEPATSALTSNTTYSATLNYCDGCSYTATTNIIVNPPPVIATEPNLTFCNGDAAGSNSFISSPTGATFSWTNSNPTIGLAASGTGSVPAFTATNPGTTPITANITATPTLGGCTGASIAYVITVNPTPIIGSVLASFTVCAGTSIAATSLTSNIVGATYSWTNSNAAIGLGASGTGNVPAFVATNTTSAPIFGVITITPTAGACNGVPVSYTITVNPIPTIIVSAPTGIVLGGAPATLSSTSSTGTYTWTPAATLSNPNISNPVASPVVTTIYNVSTVNSYGCHASATTTVTVTYAQCSLTINTNISSNATSSVIFTGATNITNQNIYIANGVTLTIDNSISFAGCNFNMGAGSKIVIQTGKTLTLTRKTHLFACGDMWDGIYIPAQGHLSVIGYSFIEDAQNAVVSQGGGNFTINSAIFNRNYKAVDVQTYTTGIHPGTISNSIFTSRYIPSFVSTGNTSNYSVPDITAYPVTSFTSAVMKSPNSGAKSPYCIYATDVNNINFGAAAAFSTNLFDNTGNGIYLLRSNATIYNNIFQNMNNTICAMCTSLLGTGIMASGTATGTNSVTIGGTASYQSNTFSDLFIALEADNYKQTSILNNTVTVSSTLGITATTGFGKYGIVVKPAEANTVDVEGNSLTNCGTGIFISRSVNGINSVSTLVSSNTITANTNGYCTTGINLTDVSNSGSTTPIDMIKLGYNTITEAYTCISATNVQNSLVIYKNPTLHMRYNGATGNGSGIKLQNCKYARIYNNTDIDLVPATSPVTNTNLNYRGIYVLTSTNNEITCNTMKNMGESMVFTGACTGSTLRNNTFNSGNRGLVLRNSGAVNGEIGTQGSSILPCGLWWNTSFAAQTYVDATTNANTNSKLWINATSQPVGFTGVPTLNSSSGGSAIAYSSASGGLNNAVGSPIDCNTIVVLRPAQEDNEETGMTKIGDKDVASEFIIYPNPNNGMMTLKYKVTENAELRIFDITGKMLLQHTLDEKDHILNIDESLLQAGVYYYSIRINDRTIKTDKIVIIK